MKLLFENWRKYLKSEILAEGGYAFRGAEGQQLTTTIRMSEVGPTLQHFSENFLKPAGVERYYPLGSTGKKSSSGDLDIVVGTGGEDTKTFKTSLLSYLQANLWAVNGEARLIGSNIAVMYPIVDSEEGNYVQIDLMLSSNPEDTAWLMSGTGDDQVKGVYRNLLLAFIAKVKSKTDGDANSKVTIQYPGGLRQQKYDGKKWIVQNVISDPKQILQALEINADPLDVETFDELATVLASDSRYLPHLKDFEEYLATSRTPEEEKQKALSVLMSKL